MGSADEERRRIDRYELIEEIGRGGMSVVYRALDTGLGREVALKLLHSHLASHIESRRRFQREAQAVARLRHEAIVEIYDYSGEDAEDIYIVMELVRGTTLRQVLRRHPGGPLPAEAAALIARVVFAALAEAHARDVVHRDIKPENILIGDDGNIKLTDFGIAHLAGLEQMTVTGQILGSPAYMSPEHIEKAVLDARADIFSAGSLLYEMAVGTPPFAGRNPHQIIKRIIEGYFDHPLSVRPAVGHHVAAVIVRCMQGDPERRYQTAEEAIRDLDEALDAVGLAESRRDLPAFLRDPRGWWSAREQEVLSRTLSLGQAQLRARRLPAAMDHFNRVLAVDPGNEKALGAVAGLSRRRRFRRALERSAVLLAVFVAVAGLIAGIVLAVDSGTDGRGPGSRDEDPGATRSGRVSQGATVGAEVEPDAGVEVSGTTLPADAGLEVVEGGAPRAFAPVLRGAPIRPRSTRRVLFVPFPQAVDIVVGGERFRYSHLDNERELAVGTHEVQFHPNTPEAAARFESGTWNVEIPEGDEPYKLRRRLRWLPAHLVVASEVDAEITVIEHGVVGRSNTRIRLSDLKDPGSRGEERVSLLVRAEGYLPVTKQVTLVAGETLEAEVALRPDDKPPRSAPPVSSVTPAEGSREGADAEGAKSDRRRPGSP